MKIYGTYKYGITTSIKSWYDYYVRVTCFPFGITVISNELIGSGIELTFWIFNAKFCLRMGEF